MRFGHVFAVVVCQVAFLMGCSDAGGMPPPVGDSDGGPVKDDDAMPTIVPCSTPAYSCPCTEIGAKHDCGRVYRYSKGHVDCSEGYLTCQEDGTWGECVGDSIYDGG